QDYAFKVIKETEDYEYWMVKSFILLSDIYLAKKDIFPMLYIAPRGLITILLYFQIESGHPEYVHEGFDQGILLVVIMVTSIIMTISLIQNGFGVQEVQRDEGTSDFVFFGNASGPVLPGSTDPNAKADENPEESAENPEGTLPNDSPKEDPPLGV
ncbi:MAG: hypothetical protein ACPGWM_01125, partial [Flavobacteriales bacterium]